MQLFCPHSTCPNHHPGPHTQWFDYHGSYPSCRQRIQRYRCRRCKRTFSSRSLSIDYWTHFHIDYSLLLFLFCAGHSIRALTRFFSTTTTTIQNRFSRLARSSLVLVCSLLQQFTPEEDFVADGLQNFCVSQDFPHDIHLLAGKESQFLYGCNYALFRRSGRKTPQQAERCKRIYPRVDFSRYTIKRTFRELLIQLQRFAANRPALRLYTDERRQYRLALREHPLWYARSLDRRFRHITVNSRKPRTLSNDLFSVNYLDREIRKDVAEYHRETVCFGRNVGNMLERTWLYFFYHNFMKPYRIGVSGEQRTHAEVAGVSRRWIEWMLARVFRCRGFLHDGAIPYGSFYEQLWRREITTPLKEQPDYLPKYAVA